MLLRNMVTERNLTECESNCRQIYVTASSCYLSNKITRRHRLEDSKFHIQCITVYYAQNPL